MKLVDIDLATESAFFTYTMFNGRVGQGGEGPAGGGEGE